jgi:phosphopentomutase
MINRVILIVIDSVGIGSMPDSESFGDYGVDTLGSIIKAYPDIKLENMRKLGLYNIEGTSFQKNEENILGAFGKLSEASNGKDTTTGHWEIAGLKIVQPFKTYPDGFPKDVMDEFEDKIGRKSLCNKPASGTVILDELGEEHMRTGMPIVYTSADSVFQIAAHEDVIPLDELYGMCRIARKILMGENQVARVIARPFVGEPGNFTRTPNRRDYSVKPFGKTVLDIIKESGRDVIAVGKIVDIFDGEGITEDVHIVSNLDGMDKTMDYIRRGSNGLVFTNLVDFDAKYGHRRDVLGYKNSLEEFDAKLEELMNVLKDDDILMITADHGNDPTYVGTDHTREYVPLMVYGKDIRKGVDLKTRLSFSDIAATISDIFGLPAPSHGESFKNEII